MYRRRSINTDSRRWKNTGTGSSKIRYPSSITFTTNIAIGVGEGNLEVAAEFYAIELGLERGQSSPDWIEMIAGPLSLYLVADHQTTPTFEILVPDVDVAMQRYLNLGCEEVEAKGAAKERFIKTPFGQFVCVSPQAT